MVQTRSQKRELVNENIDINNDNINKKVKTNVESEDQFGKIQDIIVDSIKKIVKRCSPELQDKKLNNNPKDKLYEDFNELIESIYDGNFFERIPLESRKEYLKEKISPDQIVKLKEELDVIHENYRNSSPSVIDILKMNIPLNQKQKLLEKVHCLVNSDILSHEYNTNIKFLSTNISNDNGNDIELLALEEKILKNTLNKADTYRMKILKSKMSFENKVIAYSKLEIMESYEDADTSEYAKYKSWIDSLLSIPFDEIKNSSITSNSNLNDISSYIKNVRCILDEKLSFLEKPKDQIINLVTQMIRNPNININAIGLCGNAGLGKTSIVESMAKALNRPFRMISLGGESDASSLTGHGFTYIGSKPGRLIDILIDSKTMNPIVLLDECDKISETNYGREIIGTLIHLTDSTSNSKYNHDKYFSGIEFDLSKVLFVFTYNDASKIDKILADRLIKINIDNYTFKEKLEITNKHIINCILDEFKFNYSDINFTTEAIEYIVRESKEAGMRNIKSKIKIVVSRINNLLLTNKDDMVIKLKYKKLYTSYKLLPVTVTKEDIIILLDESIDDSKLDLPPPNMYI